MTIFNYLSDNMWGALAFVLIAYGLLRTWLASVKWEKKYKEQLEFATKLQNESYSMVSSMKYQALELESDKTRQLAEIGLKALAKVYPSGFVEFGQKAMLVIELPTGQVAFERPTEFFFRHGEPVFERLAIQWDGTSGDLSIYRFDQFLRNFSAATPTKTQGD